MRKNRIKQSKKTAGKSKITNPKIYLILFTIVVLLIYARTTYFEFVHIDDIKLILENNVVTNSQIPYSETFVQRSFSVHYKPLVIASWKAEYNLLGTDPWHFHLINWLLHLANTIILFFIGIKLFEKLYDNNKPLLLFSAFLLALLFTINPLRIESVAWATERKDVLFSFFFLLSWLSYISYIGNKKNTLLVLSSLLYLLSGLSKSAGLTLFAILFLTDFWFKRKFNLKLALEKIPHLIVILLLLFLYGLLSSHGKTSTPTDIAKTVQEGIKQASPIGFVGNLPKPGQWFFTSSLRFVLWIIHSIIPIGLSIIYPHNAIYKFFGNSILLFPFITVALFFWAWKVRKKELSFLWGLLFFGIALSPSLLLNSEGQAIFLSDRYTYIPSIGLFFIMVILFNRIKFKSSKYNTILAVVVLFYFAGSVKAVGYWKNSETLFTQALKIYPDAGLAYLNMGRYYREKNNYNKALQVYAEGIAKTPGYFQLYSNRGKVYFDTGKYKEAIADDSKCLSLNPNYMVARVNRGAAYGIIKEYDKAIADLNIALESNPNNTNALSNRGLIFFQMKEYEKTIKDYTKYLSILPNNPDIINTVGLSYYRLKKYNQALIEFNKSISINPSGGAFYVNRSLLYNAMGNKTSALQDVLKAQQLGAKTNPKYINYLKQQTKK